MDREISCQANFSYRLPIFCTDYNFSFHQNSQNVSQFFTLRSSLRLFTFISSEKYSSILILPSLSLLFLKCLPCTCQISVLFSYSPFLDFALFQQILLTLVMPLPAQLHHAHVAIPYIGFVLMQQLFCCSQITPFSLPLFHIYKNIIGKFEDVKKNLYFLLWYPKFSLLPCGSLALVSQLGLSLSGYS